MSLRILQQRTLPKNLAHPALGYSTARNNSSKSEEVTTVLSKKRLTQIKRAPTEIQPKVFSTAPVASTTATAVAQKAMVSAEASKPNRAKIQKRDKEQKAARRTVQTISSQQHSSTSPLASTTTTTTEAVGQKAMAQVAATDATPKTLTDINTSLIQPTTLFIQGLLALCIGLETLVAKGGLALPVGQSIVSNTIAFLTPHVTTVVFAGKMAVEKTIAATVQAWPLLPPTLSTIVVGTFALILVTYIAFKVFEMLKSRIDDEVGVERKVDINPKESDPAFDGSRLDTNSE